ncbi:hypothetical protein [Parapedobacter sp. DT-150]|uniref:hypothetical protein n=1 Tax=Parapedobacter sp. DT-150 TaxID=3396162 RepID=UPI003F1C5AA6
MRNEKEGAWNSAIMVLTGSLAFFLMFLMGLSGILDIIAPNTAGDGPLAKRGKILIFVFPLLLISYLTITHIVFKVARASKSTGLSERFLFVPIKRDRIICWLTCTLLMSSPLILVGVKVLLGQK